MEIYPNFSLNVEYTDFGSLKSRTMYLYVNEYGLCKSICRYFKMIIVLNTTQSLYNLLYYLFGKLLHFKTRTFKNYFKNVILKQISNKILEFKNTPKSLEKLELSISVKDYDEMMNYWNNISNMGNVEDLWTEATLGFYLFLLESYVVMVVKSIEWCKKHNYSDYPDFYKSLKGNEEIFDFDKYNINKTCDDDKICLYTKYLEYGYVNGIYENIKIIQDNILIVTEYIKKLLPDSYNKLVYACYNTYDSEDKQINNDIIVKRLLKISSEDIEKIRDM
jgi:hypothetical protein